MTRNDKHQFSPYIIKTQSREKVVRIYEKNHLRENALIFYEILSTYSLWNRVEISLQNLYLDIGAYSQTRPSVPVANVPSQTVSPARHFFNWRARGAWCPYMARLLFISPINIRLLNRGSI